MFLWFSLWALSIAVEVAAYLSISRRAVANSAVRRLVFGVVAIVVCSTTVLLLREDWKFWLLPSLFVPYQLINIARAVRYRLQPDFLRMASLKTVAWLAAMQLLAVGVSEILRLNGPIFTPMIIVSLQSVVAVFLLQALTYAWEHSKPGLRATPMADRELPSLSVLIPARNATLSLQNCLESLTASDYPKLEILALDDDSSDKRTPEIIRGFARKGVRFIQGETPRPHWLAKNDAYDQLFQASSGELVLFCGVDVMVEPHTLRRLVEQLVDNKLDMLSILPLRPIHERRNISPVQTMRYWWELGWPRRIFHRPPVLSTLWLIRANTLKQSGGFAAAAQMIIPEAYFAKITNTAKRYMFMRSTPSLPVYSTKNQQQQYATAVRVRYPQTRRRISVIAATALFQLFFLVGPFVTFPLSIIYNWGSIPIALAAVSVAALLTMQYYTSVRTHLSKFWLGLITAPITFLLDIIMLHTSLFTYEFGEVNWHDRSVSRPMLEVIPKLEDSQQTENVPEPDNGQVSSPTHHKPKPSENQIDL